MPTESAAENRSRFWVRAAVAVVTVTAVLGACTWVWDSDIFWHLASGEWMLDHGRILDFDPFSIAPEKEWVNVHWLFQVIVAVLHETAGWQALSLMKAVLAGATLFVFAMGLRRRVPPAWLITSGLAMFWIMFPRVRERPETFTMLFLTIFIALLEGVRRGGSTRRLWWLVPVMLAWVNMHGLYILGVGVMGSAMIGAVADRRLKRGAGPAGGKLSAGAPAATGLWGNLPTQGALGPVLAATVACFVTPWPIEAAAQPLLLWTRVSGGTEFYTYGVSELMPTWENLSAYYEPILFVAITAVAMAVNFRRLPISHAIWLGAFIFLGLLAVRNIGLLGPVCGYLLAAHGGDILNRLGTRRPRMAKAGVPASVVMAILGLALSVGFVTEWTYHHRKSDWQWGLGLQKENFGVDSAVFLRDLEASGDILCDNFGDGGLFIYYTTLGQERMGVASPRRVFMDGRLEAHSLQRFIDQHRIAGAMQMRKSIDTVTLPETVRFVVVRHDSRDRITAMSHSARFRLIYVDRASAVFARQDWVGSRSEKEKLPDWPDLARFDRPLDESGQVEGSHVPPPRWWRQNPLPMNFQVGMLWLALGQQDPLGSLEPADLLRQKCVLLGERYLRAALADAAAPRDLTIGSLAQACLQRSLQSDITPSAAVPLDMYSVCALRLYEEYNPGRLDDPQKQVLAVQKLMAMVKSRELDAAETASATFLDSLPPRERMYPPRDYAQMSQTIIDQLSEVRLRLDAMNLPGLSLEKRVEILTSPSNGLIDRAIAEVRAAPESGARNLLLGDLLLRRGRADEAEVAYAKVSGGERAAWEPPMRLGLCQWAEGTLWCPGERIRGVQGAAELLEEAAKANAPAVVRYYLAGVWEELGDYDRARRALADAQSDDTQLQRLLDEMKARLKIRGE